MAMSANGNWKAIVGHTAVDNAPAAKDDDDWDTDPDYVNDVSEKAQRWAPNQHSGEKDPRTNFDLEELRQSVINTNDSSALANYRSEKGGDVKRSYGVKQ